MTNTGILCLPVMIGAAAMAGFAQPNRITSRIDNTRTVILPGRVHPLATAADDVGAVDSGFRVALTLLLKPSAAQQSALEQLIERQQNPASTSFHRWITPEQYAGRFGVSSSDSAQITAWLELEGFQVEEVAHSRTFVLFHGTAGQVRDAFGASIHRYRVNGKLHYANAGDPRIPAALSGVVAGIRGLNDFRPKPRLHRTVQPRETTSWGANALAPDDFATIYDVTPMYSAGINGSGQSIAVMGMSTLYGGGAYVSAFWQTFGITTAKLVQTLVSPQRDPGFDADWAVEASLDIEWSSAVARGATIVFVYSDDIWTSAEYAVDENLAAVLSMSWADCEMFDLVDLPNYRQLVQQANSQGITWVAAAGDQGAAGCDYNMGSSPVSVAEGGLAVDAPASIPEVTAMGGTMFNEGRGDYWNTTNTSTGGSAKRYIPETVWNETAESVAMGGGLMAGGGGASIYFPQPSWQTTGGVPNDGWRHVPDLAFNSGVYHDSYYINCAGIEYVGGTSAAAPAMAGVVALLNQYALVNGFQSQPGMGNINPNLYALAQTAPNAFHDIVSGDNDVPCAPGSPGCNNGTQGFPAVPGYDSASGLGSVDVANLIQSWRSQVAAGSIVVPSIDSNPVYQRPGTSGNEWPFNITLTEEAGIAATLTDFTIAVNGATTSYASQIVSLFGTAAIAPRGSIFASDVLFLTDVPQNVTFQFSGTDANGATWTTALTVAFEGAQAAILVTGIGNAASGQKAFAPGAIMSLYGTGMGGFAQTAATIPLPIYMAGFEAWVNGYMAPLWYVSPNQVNLQIPYEVDAGTAVLIVGNPYRNMTYNLVVAAAGPGIFTLPNGFLNPSQTARAGQETFLYITGEGQVTPGLADGATPAAGTTVANLPKPLAAVSMTVGGIAVTDIPFVGIPSGLVGVTQINFVIPANVPSGPQPVVVTVGTASTQTAYITIQ
jgi:uncharacterized protein (TIGR03437 family)